MEVQWLVRDGGRVESCRAVFGDESQDYSAALQRHYSEHQTTIWQNSFVSAYATMHPWEDFVETFAHYLHIVDTLETANSFGIQVHPQIDNGMLDAKIDFDSYRPRDIMALINAWVPLAFAVNCLNRSTEQPDLYPFVLSQEVIGKLGYVDALVHDRLTAVSDRETLTQAGWLAQGTPVG